MNVDLKWVMWELDCNCFRDVILNKNFYYYSIKELIRVIKGVNVVLIVL